jgi:hypothetical protein
MKLFKKEKNGANIYSNNSYPRSIEVTSKSVFEPITITLYTNADPRLPQTFACCNQAYTFCFPFEQLGLKVKVIPLELNLACYCPTCRFGWIYLMFNCPECNEPLVVEELNSPQDRINPAKFYVRGVPTIEIDGQKWIEGSGFSQSQIARAIHNLYQKKEKHIEVIRKQRWEKYLNAEYVEILIPTDHIPAPFNRRLVRKDKLKVKDSIVDLKHLIVDDIGIRVMPDEWKIQKDLNINVVTLPELGWSLKGAIVPKEQYVDLANIGSKGKTARRASTAYATRTPKGD